jgi:type 1 glutamine amidotransferase
MNRPLFALTAALIALPLVEAAPKKVLIVTATKGFRHSSIPWAENIITTLGQSSGAYTVVDIVKGGSDGKDDAEVAQKMSLDNLKNVDAVIFANTTGDLAIPDKDGFIKWVESGHALIGMHSCSDTFHGYQPFLKLLGGEFETHHSQVAIAAENQDPAHPATRHFGSTFDVFDEIYIIKNFNRDQMHGLLGLHAHPNYQFPGDYPVAWCRQQGQGRVFYTSLGHREDVWTSEAYQEHILVGIKWAIGLERGSGQPVDASDHLTKEEKRDGWKLMFNGRDLAGWKYRRPDGKRSWLVENGMLVNRLEQDNAKGGFTGHGTDIYSEDKFRDFTIRCDYQIPPNANSGLYLRGRHEIQIFDDNNKEGHDKGLNGDIYNTASCVLKASRKPGQWQSLEATIVGQNITVILNGVKVHDKVLCDHGTGSQLDDNVNDPGPILLQGDHGEVAFRNIRIKELK